MWILQVNLLQKFEHYIKAINLCQQCNNTPPNDLEAKIVGGGIITLQSQNNSFDWGFISKL